MRPRPAPRKVVGAWQTSSNFVTIIFSAAWAAVGGNSVRHVTGRIHRHTHGTAGLHAAAFDHDWRRAGHFRPGDDNLADHERMRRTAEHVRTRLVEGHAGGLAVGE